MRCSNSSGDSDEKLPQIDLPEIRAQALSSSSFSTRHFQCDPPDKQKQNKTDESWSLYWTGIS